MLERPNVCYIFKSWGFKDVKYEIPMCQSHSTRHQPIQLVPTIQKSSLRRHFRQNSWKLGSQKLLAQAHAPGWNLNRDNQSTGSLSSQTNQFVGRVIWSFLPTERKLLDSRIWNIHRCMAGHKGQQSSTRSSLSLRFKVSTQGVLVAESRPNDPPPCAHVSNKN